MKKFCLPIVATIALASCNLDMADSPSKITSANASMSVDSSACSSITNTPAKVVYLAETFMSTLTQAQLDTLMPGYTADKVVRWSNLPCGSACRNGLELINLTPAQQVAALTVIKAATGTVKNEGYDKITQIRMADDILNAAGGMGGGGGPDTTGGGPGAGGDSTGMGGGTGSSTYSSGNYFIAFLGTPSLTGTWQLQFGGHHLAVNIRYNNGQVDGATPSFRGVEPKHWTSGDTTYAPLSREHTGMVNMLAKLNVTQLAAAKLSTTFSDVLLGPGMDGQFPTGKGLAVSALNPAQKKLVLIAMAPWIADADNATAAKLMAIYTSELNDTYIAYSGNISMTSQGDYARIDGPRVWIEFVCQNGVVFANQIHYHSIWRDHTKDYGGNFTF